MIRKIIETLLVKFSKQVQRHIIHNARNIVAPENVKEHLDIQYTNRKGKTLLMDVFEPTDASQPELPLIIFIHGGGLVVGDKSMSRGFCHELVRRGFLVFALSYELIPSVSV